MDSNAVDLRTTLAAQPATRAVSVSLPSQVYFDLDQFQRVQKELLGQLGCPACTSGFDIRYDIQRRFVVDASLSVQASGLAQDPLSP
ncbi:hypothetical protein HF313_17970 [Massilia atriviolacea]|uniref:Uncharacterized protein n=1 Tax=Massilia atriviolacea TaxID=2495579 RepID=A0A430HTF4_9BURK|nr:hypothetical protein [Massilia atriviolacea]RSZ60828.1 hypothetical protein EJB06_01425 [Massilia atriviolacea]